MKNPIFLFTLITAFFFSCNDDDSPPANTNFTVRIENIGTVNEFLQSGVFNTPVGDATPGPATPGKSYEFTVDAGRNQKLSFVTMLAATNDLFFAPDDEGISLYDDSGNPISGDITDKIYLWDAGTEINEEPVVGPNTVGQQSGPDTGADENGNILMIEDVTTGFDFDYPPVNEIIRVTVTHNGGTNFTINIMDLSTATLTTSEGTSPAPISPGVYVIANGADILFQEGEPDRGQGIENIAEDGNPANLFEYAGNTTGVTYPASPGVWLLHRPASMPLFSHGEVDYGNGLEHIAEDGNVEILSAALPSLEGYRHGGVFNMPVGSEGAGPLLPGSSYEFSFTASQRDYLSFSSMLAATNDVFFAPEDTGIKLFEGTEPISGDITNQIYFWDVGTELNEQPSIGPNTVTNQTGPDTGIDETEPVQLLREVGDSFEYPELSSIYRITIMPD